MRTEVLFNKMNRSYEMMIANTEKIIRKFKANMTLQRKMKKRDGIEEKAPDFY